MRYTEDNFQAFLEELMQRIFVEYSKIGLSSERWKQSFTILTPDFGQKKVPPIFRRQGRRLLKKILVGSLPHFLHTKPGKQNGKRKCNLLPIVIRKKG